MRSICYSKFEMQIQYLVLVTVDLLNYLIYLFDLLDVFNYVENDCLVFFWKLDVCSDFSKGSVVLVLDCVVCIGLALAFPMMKTSENILLCCYSLDISILGTYYVYKGTKIQKTYLTI